MIIPPHTPYSPRRITAAAVLWFLLLSACDRDPSLTVDLYTGLAPGFEFSQVVTQISVLRPGAERDELRRVVELVVDVTPGDERFVDGTRVAEIPALPPGVYWVEVFLREEGGSVLVRQVEGPVEVFDDTAIAVGIERACVGVECPGSGPPGLLACLRGMCVDPSCSPSNPDACPPSLVCAEDSDCTAEGATCADTRCVSGTCFVFSPGTTCPDGSFCDPDVGCAHDGPTPPGCVTPVCSTGNECLLGRLDCDGAEVCSPWANAFAGSPCARGECDGDGACVGLPLELTIEGEGRVVSDPAGLDCSAGTCTSRFDRDSVVTLTALETDTSILASWSGCESTDGTHCFVSMSEARRVTATFAVPMRHVSVVVSGGGGGMVEGGGISCGSVCEIDVPSGTSLTLTATPTPPDRFGGWGGACSSAGAESCDVTVISDTVIGASFVAAADDVLRVVRLGTGSGTVSSTPAGINCGSTCAAGYTPGAMVTLTATQSPGSTFAGWSGDVPPSCGGSNTCVVTLAAALTTAEATFARNRDRVTVELAGAGAGSVSSTPAGINCPGGACVAEFDELSSLQLIATPVDSTSVFARWELVPSCGSSPICVFDVDAPLTVRAVFDRAPVTLTVTRTGAGAGTVRENVMGPLRIDCGADCSETSTPPMPIVLEATATYGSTFAGWSGTGECAGSGSLCSTTINANATVTARFDVAQWPLHVAVSGSGTGTVRSVPAGTINCGSTCDAMLDHGTNVTLEAVASSTSTFTGWAGACAGTGPCVVTMDAARDVTATFSRSLHSLTVARVGEGLVTETSPGSSINCGATCSADYPAGTRVTLVARPDMCYDFTGWGAPCSGVGPCTVTVSGPTSVAATFVVKQYTLRVTTAGGATVRGGSIDCGSTCEARYECGSVASLSASCPEGSRFDSWSVPSCGSSTSCDVVISGDTTVTATCVPITRTLSVGMTGAGTGRVVSDPSGIDCSTGAVAGCSSDFDDGQMVTLKAEPTGGWCFQEWSLAPGCGTSTTCVVTMDMARSVEARFDSCVSETCRVDVTTIGAGEVTSSPGGISCGRTCGAEYMCTDRVTLRAISLLPVTWSGGCTVDPRDANTCYVVFPPNTASITARFGGGPA